MSSVNATPTGSGGPRRPDDGPSRWTAVLVLLMTVLAGLVTGYLAVAVAGLVLALSQVATE